FLKYILIFFICPELISRISLHMILLYFIFSIKLIKCYNIIFIIYFLIEVIYLQIVLLSIFRYLVHMLSILLILLIPKNWVSLYHNRIIFFCFNYCFAGISNTSLNDLFEVAYVTYVNFKLSNIFGP
ncbi:hypothetical protein H312_00263, partial [Anncaliia algerae PRA339]